MYSLYIICIYRKLAVGTLAIIQISKQECLDLKAREFGGYKSSKMKAAAYILKYFSTVLYIPQCEMICDSSNVSLIY